MIMISLALVDSFSRYLDLSIFVTSTRRIRCLQTLASCSSCKGTSQWIPIPIASQSWLCWL